MNIKHAKITTIVVSATALLAFAGSALATDVTVGAAGTATGGTSSVTVGAKLGANDSKLRDKSKSEITKRVDDLNTLTARIDSMTHVSASTKAMLNASMQSNITALTNLENKIGDDTDSTTLKTDVGSITKAYRIYQLVAPQTRILAAADRASTIGNMITALDVKFQTRIAAATAAGRDTTSILSAETDMKAKIADASVQANAAIAYVSNLSPDNGDATVLASNTTALTKARADLRVAMSDLTTAQKDIKTIVSTLKGFNLDTSTTATTQQ